LTIREKRHEAQAQLLALRAEHKKDWVVQRLDVVVGEGLSDTVYFVWEGREIVCGELGDIMVVQRVVKHFCRPGEPEAPQASEALGPALPDGIGRDRAHARP
jgi:hypothetical protein